MSERGCLFQRTGWEIYSALGRANMFIFQDYQFPKIYPTEPPIFSPCWWNSFRSFTFNLYNCFKIYFIHLNQLFQLKKLLISITFIVDKLDQDDLASWGHFHLIPWTQLTTRKGQWPTILSCSNMELITAKQSIWPLINHCLKKWIGLFHQEKRALLWKV